MRVALQIVLFIFIAPICVGFCVFGGCLVGAVMPAPLQSGTMVAGMITGLVGGLLIAGLIVQSLRRGRI
jgi:hypothetical protein